jgi:hypothetical protein
MILIAPRTHEIGFHSLGATAIAGTLVAYVDTRGGVDSGSSSIIVVDVATRRVLRSVPGVATYVDAGIIRSEHVRSLAVIAPDGATAWIVEAGTRGRPKTLRVYDAARTGPARLVDEGSDIGAESLRVSGRTISWAHGTGTRSADLPH